MNMTKKHMLIILACCLVPLAALATIAVFNIPGNTVIYFGIMLLSPLLHFALMRNMGHQLLRNFTYPPTRRLALTVDTPACYPASDDVSGPPRPVRAERWLAQEAIWRSTV